MFYSPSRHVRYSWALFEILDARVALWLSTVDRCVAAYGEARVLLDEARDDNSSVDNY